MARPRKTISAADPALLAAALEGLELQKARLEGQISAVRAALGIRRGRPAAAPPAEAAEAAKPQRRKLSAAARKRIAAAQKKRWADYRKKKGGSAD